MPAFSGVGRPGKQTHLFCFNDDLMIALDLFCFLPVFPLSLISFPVSSRFPVTKNSNFILMTLKATLTVVQSAVRPLACPAPHLRPPSHQTQCLHLTVGGEVAFKSSLCFPFQFLQHLTNASPGGQGIDKNHWEPCLWLLHSQSTGMRTGRI